MVAQAVRDHAKTHAALMVAMRPYRERLATATFARSREPDCSLLNFFRECWSVLEPGVPLVEGFHVAAICEHLEAVTWGDVRDLLITIPPRMTKSSLVSVAWPAWEWTFRPEERFLTASYVQEVATQDAVRTRDLIRSYWFQERWGHVFHLRADQNLKTRYSNDKTGYRIAIGARGRTTSLGGSRLIVDDPHNVMDAGSYQKRQEVIRWWDVAMSTRHNDAKTGTRVIVQQRVHEGDLAGHVIRQGGFVHLNLPMEYEPTPEARTPTAIGWVDPRTEPGELLIEERFGRSEVEKAKQRMGPVDYAAQHQQHPSPMGGAIYLEQYWRWYRVDLPHGTPGSRPSDADLEIVCFVDTASKEGEENAFTVFAVWGRTGDRAYLLQEYRERLAFPRLLAKTAQVWGDWHERGLTMFVVEDKSSGVALIQLAQNPPTGMQRFPVKAWSPGTRDKVQRANMGTGWMASGAAALPAWNDGPLEDQIPWLREFVQEHTEFPKGDFADRVDTTTMMLHWWFVAPETEHVQEVPIVAPGGSVGPALATTGASSNGYREGPQDDDY
jgi:predicted phage terminase large subunit-like protein